MNRLTLSVPAADCDCVLAVVTTAADMRTLSYATGAVVRLCAVELRLLNEVYSVHTPALFVCACLHALGVCMRVSLTLHVCSLYMCVFDFTCVFTLHVCL
eukprot:Lankesteria_metandrocarpae@DN274_c0_g1_i1.p1